MQTQSRKRTSNAALGMMLGTVIGGAIGVLLFVFTQQPLFIAIAGLGTAVGLVWGAGVDRARQGTRA